MQCKCLYQIKFSNPGRSKKKFFPIAPIETLWLVLFMVYWKIEIAYHFHFRQIAPTWFMVL